MPCVGAISLSYLFRPSSVDVCFRCLSGKKMQLSQHSLFTDCVWEKNCSESQKLGFIRLEDDLPTLLRNLWRMGRLHDGSICCQDFGSFAKILTTHETAKRSLHTEKLMIFVGIPCTCTLRNGYLLGTCCTRTAAAVEEQEFNSCSSSTF